MWFLPTLKLRRQEDTGNTHEGRREIVQRLEDFLSQTYIYESLLLYLKVLKILYFGLYVSFLRSL